MTLRCNATGFAGPGPITGPGERAAARRVLSSHLYTQYHPTLLERYEDDVYRFLAHLLDTVPLGAAGGSVLGLLAVVAVVVALVSRRLGPVRSARGPGWSGLSGPLSAAQYRAEGIRAAAAGNWDAAVTAAMRGLARGLEERDLVGTVSGRTAHELAVRAGLELPSAAPALHAAARAFDDVRFGGRPADEPAYRTIEEADQRAQAERPQRAVSVADGGVGVVGSGPR